MFLPEPVHLHGVPRRTAVVLMNLGTPDAPTAPAVRRYLQEFLSDRRVVEIPRILWQPLLHGVILRVRPRRSAMRYASIWGPGGSPLKVHSEQQELLLRGYLGDRGLAVDVALAMRYGEPSIPSVIRTLLARGVERMLLLPLYPQYSATTTASCMDAVHATLSQVRNVPEIRWVKHYHDAPGYIAALRDSVLGHWRGREPGQRLLMSFHGVPRRTLDLGDPYHCECFKTARLLGDALGMAPARVVVSFQSRLGRAQWLQPYTAPTLAALARDGIRSVDVICPGFSADCLETLEEIAQEGRDEFIKAGGTTFNYIPCLNDAPAFITALADLAQAHMAGWPVTAADVQRASAELQEGKARALALGAPR